MTIKVAMHVHSTWSYDGKWPLERLASEFAGRGYQVLLMTEHDQGFSEERRLAYWEACRKASTERLLIIPGIEYSDPSNTIHILVWGNIPFLGTGRETMEILEQATNQGGICVFAHPSRRKAWQMFRPEWLRHLAGIEIWNRKTDGWSASPDAIKLIAHTKASALVGLDFHSPKQFHPLALLLDLDGSPDESKVLDALRSGRYRCHAFGVNVSLFTHPAINSMTNVVEGARRLAARSFRFAIANSSSLRSSFSSRSKRNETNRPPPERVAK
ncbi:MAG TPA: hypothetical protein VGM64_03195 [Lacunisphaera sp.]|jgi:hypothetical protein